MSTRRSSTVLRGLSAFLAGASGLALESMLVSAGGLALGYGGSVAIGLSLWLAAWALGAWCTAIAFPLRGENGGRRRVLAAVGVALALLSPASVWVVLWAGDAWAGRWFAPWLAGVAIAAPAFLQGFFLPVLACGTTRVGALFASNLAGCLAGAYLVSDLAVGAFGRLPAAWIAGGIALVAALLGASAPQAGTTAAHGDPRIEEACTTRRAACTIGLAVAWMSALEWVSLRLGVLWLGGMQNALNAVLCSSLLALALGAALLPLVLPRGSRGIVALLCLCVLASLWPFVAAFALEGATDAPLFVRAFILSAPTMLPFGALVPVVHAACAGERGPGGLLGSLLFHESWGALLGIPLVHFVIVPWFGLPGAIAAGLLAGAIALIVMARTRSLLALSSVTLALAACTLSASWPTPALASPALANPAFSLKSVFEDRDFTVAVVDDGLLGERTLLTDGFRAAGTGRDYLYMEALGHLPLVLHPSPRRVAVLALGTGTTLGAVYLHPEVERIDVLEISRAVVDAAPFFLAKNHGALSEGLPGLLDDSDGAERVVVRLGDGRATLARARGAFDVITMEPLLPDSPFAVYLYTREFYALARRSLKPNGLVCQWVPPHALEPVTFDGVLDAFAASFPWSGAWLFGTQVLLVGGEREPILDPARFESSSSTLQSALASLGLDTPTSLVARWCGPLAASASQRSLTDADPWIVYRIRRAGAVLLADLGLNLARMCALEREPSTAWLSSTDRGAPDAIAGMRALRAARTAHAFVEAELRGVRRPEASSFDLDASLARARDLVPDDPEFARFTDEIAFLDGLRAGVSALSSNGGREAAAQALDPLIAAARLRPERADVHLYCAIALERLGQPKAAAALELARTLCPGLRDTSAGARAQRLGLSDALWAVLSSPAVQRR